MKCLSYQNRSNKKLVESEVVKKLIFYFQDSPIIFLGFLPENEKLSTRKVASYCKLHGNLMYSTTVHSLLNGNQIPCGGCRGDRDKEKTRLRQRLQVMPYLENYKDVEVIGDGKVTYRCDTCHFTYGIDTITKSIKKLSNAKALCGCYPSGFKNKTKAMYSRELSHLLKESYRFLYWLGEEVGSKSKFKYLCPVHGIQIGAFWDFKQGCRCPDCAVTGFSKDKSSELYLLSLKDLTGEVVYYKVGITNNFKDRVRVLSRSTKLTVGVVQRYTYTKGTTPLAVESEVKNLYKNILGIDARVLSSGFTETFRKDVDVLQGIQKIIQSHGGFNTIISDRDYSNSSAFKYEGKRTDEVLIVSK